MKYKKAILAFSYLLFIGFTGCVSEPPFALHNDQTYFEIEFESDKLQRNKNKIIVAVDDSVSMQEEIAQVADAVKTLAQQLENPQGREAVDYSLHMLRLSNFEPFVYSSNNSVMEVRGSSSIASGVFGDASITGFLDGLTYQSLSEAQLEIEAGIGASYKAIQSVVKRDIRILLQEILVQLEASNTPLEEVDPQGAFQEIIDGVITLEDALQKYPDHTVLPWLALNAEDKTQKTKVSIVLLSDEDNARQDSGRDIYIDYVPENTHYTYKFRKATAVTRNIYTNRICERTGNPNNIDFSNINHRFTCKADLEDRVRHSSGTGLQSNYRYCRRPKRYLCKKEVDGVEIDIPVTSSIYNMDRDYGKANCRPDPASVSDTKFEDVYKSVYDVQGLECAAYTCERNFHAAHKYINSPALGPHIGENSCGEGYDPVPVQRGLSYHIRGQNVIHAINTNYPEGVREAFHRRSHEDVTQVLLTRKSNADALADFRAQYPDLSDFHDLYSGYPKTASEGKDSSIPNTKKGFLTALSQTHADLDISFHSFVSKVNGKCDENDQHANVRGTEYMLLSEDPKTKGIIGDICEINVARFLDSIQEEVVKEDKRSKLLPGKVDVTQGKLQVWSLTNGRTLEYEKDYHLDETHWYVIFEEEALLPGEQIKIKYSK